MTSYQPFIGFTYNGKHSIDDLHIYRVSSGNRYDENITATMLDKTVDIPGRDGQYYFGTAFRNRTFTVNYVFNDLTKTDIQEIKRVFCGDGVYDLIFDEDRANNGEANKIWSAKVTGTVSMKHLCFEEKGKDIYKGEGSIVFTCYYPYARKHRTIELQTAISEIYPPYNPDKNKHTFTGEIPTTFVATFQLHSKAEGASMKDILFYVDEGDEPEYKITLSNAVEVPKGSTKKVVWNSKTGLVTFDGQVVASTGPTLLKVQPGDRMRFRIKNGEFYPTWWNITVDYDALYR